VETLGRKRILLLSSLRRSNTPALRDRHAQRRNHHLNRSALLKKFSDHTRSVSVLSYGYGYDAASRLTNVNDSAAYTYVANSPLVSTVTFKDGSTTRMMTTKQYDLMKRLISISSQPSASGERPIAFTYAYNDVNQRRQRKR
jgi:hypothetical protein